MGERDEFGSAGRTLFSLGLVREAEGNLSMFVDGKLRITRTGAHLDRLGPDDLLEGSLSGELSGASSDLEVHRQMYRQRGPGAVVHTHPLGTVPEGGGGPGRHGLYVHAATLGEAVERTVDRVRHVSERS